VGEIIRENGKKKKTKYVIYILMTLILIAAVGLFLLPFLGMGGY
jgi:flagellar basal body-associated protein FliL